MPSYVEKSFAPTAATSASLTAGNSGGNTYPQNFIGPIRTQDTRAYPGFVGPTYGAPNNTGSGQVLGAMDGGGGGASSGGGGGNSRVQQLQTIQSSGNGLNPAQQTELEGLLQQSPQAPNINFDELIAPALQALDAAVAPQDAAYQANLSDIEAGRQSQVAGNQSALAQAQTAAEQARGRNTAAGEDAINQQRRALSEVQQGLQARYGSTTGTGRFAGEIAGSQATRNIGGIQTAVIGALQEVDNNIEKVRTTAMGAIQDAEGKAQSLKLQARSQYEQALANIRIARGELLGRKQELASQATQFYQQQLAQVDANNTTFKQNIYMQAKAAEQQLSQARTQATTAVQKLSTVGNVGSTASNLGVVGSQNAYTSPTSANIGVNTNTRNYEKDIFGG